MIVRLRWRLAELANRLPGTCWSSLAGWAQFNDIDELRDGGWRDTGCRRDVAGSGSCWCGKLRLDASVTPALSRSEER